MNAGERRATSRPFGNDVLDDATVDFVLTSLFECKPTPHLIAVSEAGIRVRAPDGLPIAPACILTDVMSALEFCVPADLEAMVDAWLRARRTRVAQVTIRQRSNPQHSVTFHFIDATHRYGVYLVFIEGLEAGLDQRDTHAPLFATKICTFYRTELGIVSRIDDATTKVLGWNFAELGGKRLIEITHPDDCAIAVATWMNVLRLPADEHRCVLRYRHRDGRYLWFEVTITNVLADPVHGYVTTDLLDISDRMEAVAALRASVELLRRLTEALPLGIVQIDLDQNIIYRNERLSAIVDVGAAHTLNELLCKVVADDMLALQTALAQMYAAAEPADVELTVASGGNRRRCNVGMRALLTESGAVTGAIMCISDITERVRLREELEMRAKFDQLTRCYNRASILEALTSVLDAPQPPTTGMAVMFIDLDRFKDVNDRYGHAAGDELLRLTGQRLLQFVRDGDLVGRLGGDEFLVVCPNVPSPDGALDIAQRLARSISECVTIASDTIVPGSSIGVAWTNGPIALDSLVASADTAMYESKRGNHAPVVRIATPPTFPDYAATGGPR